jgi:hypothetical protein
MEPKGLRKALSCCAAFLIAACNPAAIRDNELRVAARNAAEARFASLCGTVTVPERAFLAIEITGDGHNDYVLSFARAACRKNPALWVGTGESLFQVWTDEGGDPRMILEQNMRGFRHDYKSAVLTTDQRGDSCPGGESSEICRVLYRWDPPSSALTIAERQPRPVEPLPVPDTIASREASAPHISARSQARTNAR